MDLVLFGLGSFVLLVPLIYLLPLGFTTKGKHLIVVTTVMIASFTLLANLSYDWWQSILLLLLLVVLSVYIIHHRFHSLIYERNMAGGTNDLSVHHRTAEDERASDSLEMNDLEKETIDDHVNLDEIDKLEKIEEIEVIEAVEDIEQLDELHELHKLPELHEIEFSVDNLAFPDEQLQSLPAETNYLAEIEKMLVSNEDNVEGQASAEVAVTLEDDDVITPFSYGDDPVKTDALYDDETKVKKDM